MTFEPYDPTWLIKLAQDQLSYEKWLPEALSLCTQCHKESEPYPHLYFFDPMNPGDSCPKWQSDFERTLAIPEGGQVFFDVLKNNCIVGIALIADEAMEDKYHYEKWEVKNEIIESEYRAMVFEPYDPTWLVKLAEEQFPQLEWLASALSTCTQYNKDDEAYYYFVNPLTPYAPGLELSEGCCILLLSPERGEIVVDIGKDKCVHGIELLYELTGEKEYFKNCRHIIID
jgi:hypothetical protein